MVCGSLEKMSGRKRLVVVSSVVLVAACILSVTAFAAVPGSVSTGFDLWDLLDGLGGFFRDLINYIGRFIANVISAIKNATNAVLNAISKIIKAIGEGISYILSGLKYLFIPSKESFTSFRDDILTRFDKKFGSVFSALSYLNNRFRGLGAKRDLRETFKVTFPDNSFLRGLSIDFLSVAAPVLAFFRFCITGFVCLETALMCYNKAISMVNT